MSEVLLIRKGIRKKLKMRGREESLSRLVRQQVNSTEYEQAKFTHGDPRIGFSWFSTNP